MNESSFIANGGNFTFPDKANVRPERLFFRLPLDRINWLTSSFLIGTLALTLTAVPLYLWFFGLDWFQVVLFFAMLAACGFSVTLRLPPAFLAHYLPGKLADPAVHTYFWRRRL